MEDELQPKKLKYPKCYIDNQHDGDPICKECALDLYEKLPKKSFKYPRNCWVCNSGDELDEDSEPFYE